MYDEFGSVAAAKKAYRRKRKKISDFILSDACVERSNLRCAVCGGLLRDKPLTHPDVSKGYRGNRCEYYPRSKQVVVMHYLCSWDCVFADLFKLADAGLVY